jgi:HEPN domain-containing protein
MKTNEDVAQGLVRKADTDLRAMRLMLRSKLSEAACFHAQQAAKKMLKAYLVSKGHDFPFTHDLTRLLAVVVKLDPRFRKFLPSAKKLTPYAVEVRYSADFIPKTSEARIAGRQAEAIARFVLARMNPQKPASVHRRPKRRSP